MSRNLKIAFMTTLGVNVGDEFIREGICSFLDEIFESWEPFYVNKHNLSTLYEPCEDERTVLEDKFRDADIIIQAGAPVYWNLGESTCYNVEWAEELWRNRIFQLGPAKPILNIAAGACQPFPDFARTFLADPACVQFARDVSAACRWTSVRDPLASQILYALSIDHEVLPCSAFHAPRRTTPQRDNGQVVGINLMPMGGHLRLKDDIDEGLWRSKIEAFLPHLRRHHNLFFIAHDLSEKEFMRQFLGPGEVVFHSFRWRDYLPAYARCSGVIANRVHGAVCAAGFGMPSVILGNDTRLLIGDYIDIPSRYINDVSPEEIVDLLETGLANKEKEKDRLLTLREDSAARYREAMIGSMEEFSGSFKPLPVGKTSRQEERERLTLQSTTGSSPWSFEDFIINLDCFAQRLGLQQVSTSPKSWQYPWVWFNCLQQMDWNQIRLFDLGGASSPISWFIASLGASVNFLTHDGQQVSMCEKVARDSGLEIDCRIASTERLPFPNEHFDVVMDFSLREKWDGSSQALKEITRVLKPGGWFAVGFDICEPDRVTLSTVCNKKCLTIKEFQELIWENPAFDLDAGKIGWKAGHSSEWINEGLDSIKDPQHVFAVAILKKRLRKTADLNDSWRKGQKSKRIETRNGIERKGKEKQLRQAGEGVHNLTAIELESYFAKCIRDLFNQIHPKKIIETGTYLGTGTTTIIASTLQELGIDDAKFFSIEVNPEYYREAIKHLSRTNLIRHVTLINGLSIPRKMLPTLKEIEDNFLKNIKYENIFIDHEESKRAQLYYQETDFSNVPDDMLQSCLKEFDDRPDFLLLDSAGHIGKLEFGYLVSLLKGECYIALDDIYHIKHHENFLKIKDDNRFQLIISSKEKFGFCIAKFSPRQKVSVSERNSFAGRGREDIDRGLPAAKSSLSIPPSDSDGPVELLCRHSSEDEELSRRGLDIKRCRNVLIPRLDAFGDIVLLEGFIETLLDYLPEASVTLLVREGYDQLAELFPQRLIWKSIRINPYIRAYGRGEIISLLAELSAGSYDLLLATRYDRTWLDDLIATKLTSAWRVAIGDVEHVPDYYLEVLEDLGLESPLCPYNQVIPVEEKTHEPSKYQVFWERLIGKEKPVFPSELKVSENILKIAEDVLKALHLKEGSFFLCCPAGTANISHKKWPEDNFAAVIASLENKFGLTALVVAHEAELEIMNKVISLARQKGAQPKLWSGKDGDIPLACALAEKSVFYLGNDTGLMHMTAALRKPVLAIFGGGHWPRFLPQSHVGRIFVSPMPCFYCTWKCLFSKPHCMYYPSVDKIIDEIELAVGQILQGTGDFKVVEIEPSYRQHLILLEDALDQVKMSRRLFKETDARLAERLEEIEAYERQLKQMRTLLEESNAEREARLEIIERQQEEFTKKVQEIEADRKARLELISDLGSKLEESENDRKARLELISHLGRKLEESETDRDARLSLVKELSGRIDKSERDRAARLELIEELGRKLEESETDRAARLEVITNLKTTLQESERSAEEVLHKLSLVSIVTPVFNAEKWIERCINSILSQDYPRIEHIIVDGGSKDNTLEICSKYQHLIIHSGTDRGQSDAINKGFSIATGELLAWLCADDEYEPNAVSVAVQELQKGAQFVMGNSRFIDADGKFISDHPANQYPFYDHSMLIKFWKFTPISQPATFWQRGLWEACGPLRENLYFAMDYDLWLRMSQRTKFARVPTFFAKYRIHPEAKCFSDNYGSRIELIQVSRKYWPVKWSPRYWIYFFQYLITASNITKHYADGEKLLNNCVGHLDDGKRLRAMGSFSMAHIKHFSTPLLPEYRLVLKRMLKEGVGLQWFWRFTHRISSIFFPKKELSLVLTNKKEQDEDYIILKADSRGYKQPQFRFWGSKGGSNDFVLLRDWETENTCVLKGASKNFGAYGVHIRAVEDEDFADQAWVKHLS